jgi:hypothetical protein
LTENIRSYQKTETQIQTQQENKEAEEEKERGEEIEIFKENAHHTLQKPPSMFVPI